MEPWEGGGAAARGRRWFGGGGWGEVVRRRGGEVARRRGKVAGWEMDVACGCGARGEREEWVDERIRWVGFIFCVVSFFFKSFFAWLVCRYGGSEV